MVLILLVTSPRKSSVPSSQIAKRIHAYPRSSAKFPSLASIGGALNVDTASSSFDCSQLPTTGSQIVRGKSSCTIGDKSKVGGSSTGSSSAATSSSFAYAQEIPASFLPVFGLIAGLLFA